MRRSFTVFASVLLCGLLAGCSGSKGITSMQQLTNKVDMVANQQDQMMGMLNNTKAAADAAYQQAVRANQRIDQIGRSYMK